MIGCHQVLNTMCRDNPGSWNVMLGGLYGGKNLN